MRFEPEARFRAVAEEAVARETGRLRALVPSACVEHVGSTAVPGSLTKGDVDLQVRVPPEGFAAAEAALAGAYERNLGSAPAPGFAAFERKGPPIDVGVQLTAIGSERDFFWRLRDLLLARPDLRLRYDALKRAHEQASMAAYRAAKERFFEALLAMPELAALPDPMGGGKAGG